MRQTERRRNAAKRARPRAAAREIALTSGVNHAYWGVWVPGKREGRASKKRPGSRSASGSNQAWQLLSTAYTRPSGEPAAAKQRRQTQHQSRKRRANSSSPSGVHGSTGKPGRRKEHRQKGQPGAALTQAEYGNVRLPLPIAGPSGAEAGRPMPPQLHMRGRLGGAGRQKKRRQKRAPTESTGPKWHQGIEEATTSRA